MGEECRKHLFPFYTPDPQYFPLKLAKISGPLLFLFLFLCLSCAVFVFEILLARCKNVVNGQNQLKVLEPVELQISISNKVEMVKNVSMKTFSEILALIEKDEETDSL